MTGRTISTVLREVITSQLGAEQDVHFGVPPSLLPRVARQVPYDVPSEGTMTARGVARIYAALLGHIDGVALVSPRRLAAMAAVTVTATDEVMGFPSKWAFGYAPVRPGGVPSRSGSAFAMVGTNGSAAYADVDSGIAVAVMRNCFNSGDLTTVVWIDRIVAETLPQTPRTGGQR